MTAMTLEQRVVSLAQRYDAIERAVKELNTLLTTRTANKQQHHTTAHNSASVTNHTSNHAHQHQHNGVTKTSTGTTTAPTVLPPNLQPCERDTPAVAALRVWCAEHGLHSARFKWVASDFYDQTLQNRRDILGAPTIHHLCKTIVLENTHCVHEDCAVRENARFYLIVYQYVAKFDADMVMRAIRELNPGLGKKKFNFRLADPDKALALTGFTPGSIIPFGTRTAIPVILSAELMKLSPPLFWVGGGHLDCKTELDTAEFVHVMEPLIAPISVPLSPEELQHIAD